MMRSLPLPTSVFPKIAAVTTLLVVWLAWGSFSNPETFWAPGDLSRYHADTQRCSACHEAFEGPRREKCMGCHRGPEFLLPLNKDRRVCLDCHTEHRGRMARVTMEAMGNPHAD